MLFVVTTTFTTFFILRHLLTRIVYAEKGGITQVCLPQGEGVVLPLMAGPVLQTGLVIFWFSCSRVFACIMTGARVGQYGLQLPGVVSGGGRQCPMSADADASPGIMHP